MHEMFMRKQNVHVVVVVVAVVVVAQFMKVYESLQALVSPGKVESITSDEETDTVPVT